MADIKHIKLSSGERVSVDATDYEFLNQWKWYISAGYAYRAVYYKDEHDQTKSYKVSMHRQILGCPPKLVVDHIDMNPLNNTRANLRVATKSQNQWNRGINKNNTSGHKGIGWDKVNKKWRATLDTKDKCYNLGRFDTIEEAVEVRIKHIQKVHGQFARQV